jgi:6-phosphogluconolactonase
MTDTALAGNRIFNNAETLAHDVAAWICGLALASNRTFAICLSGGSTPRRLYECFAEPGLVERFPWGRVHWFWGDERFVPREDRDSNYKMARDAFLSRAPVRDSNIHPIPTEGMSPEQAAVEYETTLKRFYGAESLSPDRPLLDLNLLGIGENGHTASLFPGQPALRETKRWALAVTGEAPKQRITLTYPVLNSSRDAVFVVTGGGKARIAARAQAGDKSLPASMIRPIGRLHWFMDRAAAPEAAN